MARSVNKVTVIAHAGADAETKYTADGQAITSLRLAANESWTDKSGQKQERVEWFRVKCFGKLGEIAGEYVKKGSQVYIEGSLRTDRFTGDDGIERFVTEIVARDLVLLGSGAGRASAHTDSRRPAAQTQRSAGSNAHRSGQDSRASATRPVRAAAGGGAVHGAPDNFNDDDIPF